MSAPSTDRPDADSREGAEALAAAITGWWRDRGIEIAVSVEYADDKARWVARVQTPIAAAPATGRRA